MKKGVSLIAVLMFMLAATTASVVLFKWIGQENFGSGARLKKSEAYQASQAGLEAVQGWLTNKGADAGALIRTFELNNGKPVLMKTQNPNYDLLGEIASNRDQKFNVYLTGIDVSTRTYKMKFISVGEGRDGSKYSQAGIFNVEGLYRIGLEPKPITTYTGGGGRRVPPYFGGFGGGTQGNFSSGYIIGDMIASQGISSTEDLMVTGSVNVSSGMKIGCPNSVGMGSSHPGDATYKTNRDAGEYGNFYVRENLTTQSIMICGDAYIGGDFISKSGSIDIWGNLYVKGNITSTNTLRVYGNVTVEGDMVIENILDIRGNLVMPAKPLHSISLNNANNVNVSKNFWGATTVNCSYKGADRCGRFTGNNNYYPGMAPPGPPGGDALDYLGNQISANKVDGKYIIPDPIVLGAAELWKTLDIPTNCTALRNPRWYSSGVIKLDNVSGNIQDDNGARDLRDAIHSCYDLGGNWNGSSNGTKWLVIRIEWLSPNDAIGRMVLGRATEMNLIFVIDNKPTQNHNLYLPLTTDNTNILLYLTQGAGNIYLDRPKGTHNYFIYSEADIDRIDGNQYLKGNLFMKNGSKVNAMQDPRIEENENLFEALSNAGVIKNNTEACQNTVGGCEEGGPGGEVSITPQDLIGCETLSNECNPALPYVPVIPHLKVELQSLSANEEKINTNNFVYAKPAILVMPRVIYLQANTPITKEELAKRVNLLYLNRPDAPPTDPANKAQVIGNFMQTNCNNIFAGQPESNLYSCTVKPTDCNETELCRNSFYVARGVQPTSFEPVEPPIEPDYSSSSSSKPSSSSSSSSSSNQQQTASGLTCSVSPAVAEGSKLSSAITALCNYSNGTYEWAIIDEYYNGTSWIPASNTTATLTKGNDKLIKIKAKCSSADQIAEYECGTLSVVGITCAFSGFSNASFGLNIARGQQINGPIIECTNGATAVKDNAIFSSNLSNTTITPISDVNKIDAVLAKAQNSSVSVNSINEKGWISFNGFSYFASGPAGVHTISISNVSCGNVSGLNATCNGSGTTPSFTVKEPACTSPGLNQNVGNPIDIPAYCDQNKTVPMTNAVFGSTSGGWINNGNGGVFTQTGNGKNINLKSGECWGRLVSGFDIACGTVNVSSSSSSGDGCDYNPAWCGYISKNNVDKESYNYPQTNSQYAYEGSSNGFDVGSGGKCVFASSITTMGNTSYCSYYRVNGMELKSSYGSSLDLNAEPDYCSVGSGRCGRINLETSQPAWGQQLCSNALANVPKADGGYYIYIAPGWVGDFITTGGTPVCSGGGGNNVTLSCTGLQSTVAPGGTISTPALACSDGQTPSNINWTGRPNNSWQAISNAQNGDQYNISATAQCGGSTLAASCGTVTVAVSTINITCTTNNSGCYERNTASNNNTGTPVPRPNVYCNGVLKTTGAASFYYNGTNAATGWDNPGGTQRFNSNGDRPITMRSLDCDGTMVNASSDVSCGNVTIKDPGSCSPPAVTVTSCTPQSIGNPSNNCYSVPRPTIVCSDGSTAGATVFQIDNSSTLSNWKSSNDPQSFCNPGNNRPIHLTSVVCGSTTVATGLPYSCGSITIPSTTTPATISCNTSNFTKACYGTSNDPVPRPNVSCSNNSATGVADFRIDGGSSISNWNNAGSTHQITSAGNKAIALHSLSCGGTTIIANPDVSCGSVTIGNCPTTATISCNTNNLNACYATGTPVPRPNASCSNGTATTADFRISSDNGTGTPATVSGWNSVNGSNSMSQARTNAVITLHKLACDGTDVTPSSPINCGTITIGNCTPTPTISCNTSGFKTCYQTSNDPVPRPTVSCSNGAAGVADFRINGGSSSISNWSNTGGTYQITSAGSNAITLNSLNCGGTTITANPAASCGTVTVASSCGGGGTDYCYGVTPNVTKGQNVLTTDAVCAKISGNIGGWNTSNSTGRTCRVNGGSEVSPATQQPATTAGSDGYVYIYCSAGSSQYFNMNWW